MLKFVFSKKATKLMTSSPSIWQLLHTVKLTVKILSIFVAFSENVNFNAVTIKILKILAAKYFFLFTLDYK